MATDAARQTEANRMYWGNEASVGEIASRLGISRRALYEVLTPQPAGVPCPKCVTAMVFVNRTAMDSGTARCPACETETEVPAARDEAPDEVVEATSTENSFDPHQVALGGAALAGIAVGAIAALLLTRRN